MFWFSYKMLAQSLTSICSLSLFYLSTPYDYCSGVHDPFIRCAFSLFSWSRTSSIVAQKGLRLTLSLSLSCPLAFLLKSCHFKLCQDHPRKRREYIIIKHLGGAGCLALRIVVPLKFCSYKLDWKPAGWLAGWLAGYIICLRQAHCRPYRPRHFYNPSWYASTRHASAQAIGI